MRRKTGAVFVILALILLGAAGTVGSTWAEGPTTEQLTADIETVDRQIEAAEQRAEQYGAGSLIRAQIDLELATLRTTRAMLDQKRKSWLRGIALTYTVEGKPLTPAVDEMIKKAEEDIQLAEVEQKVAEAKAGSYGGLVGAMALAEVQTHRVTVAMARQRLVMLRLGMALPAGSGPTAAPKPAEAPIGKTVDEKGAL